MRVRVSHGFVIVALLAVSLAAVEIKLPEETARLAESPLPGYAPAVTYCYTCHSTDYVRYQPSMSRAGWKASIIKMQKTFGAPIPDNVVDPIAEYLAKTYGAERENVPGPAAPPKTTSEKGATRRP